MKMTNEEMVINIELLSRLSEKGKLGYAIARNTRKLKDGCAEFLEARAKLFAKYGQPQPNGRTTVPPDVYKEKLGDIKDIEHDVDLYTIDEDAFCSGNLTSTQMSQLLWMVREG